MRDGLVPVVIEVEVLHREHPDRAHEVRVEEPPLFVGGLELLEPLEQLGQTVPPVHQHAVDPPAVVQPEVVGVHALARQAQELRDAPLHRDGAVADPHRAHARVVVQGLHHDPDGVREVHEQRVGRHLLDQPRVREHGGDRPKRHGEPAGARRLLPEHAVFERHLLVDGTGRLLPRPDRREDEPRAGDGRAGVGLAADREPGAPLRTQVPAERRHQLQALVIGVVQHDLVQPEVVLTGSQPAQHERRAHARPEHRQLHDAPPVVGSVMPRAAAISRSSGSRGHPRYPP